MSECPGPSRGGFTDPTLYCLLDNEPDEDEDWDALCERCREGAERHAEALRDARGEDA